LRSDFAFDAERDLYVCPEGEERYRRTFSTSRDGVRKAGTIGYRASKFDCETCPLKSKCCPNAVARRIARSTYEAARDKARAIAKTAAYVVSRRERKKVEMLFAHPKHPQARPIASAGSELGEGRVPTGGNRAEFAEMAKLVPLPAPTVAA
jgi:hypothetical protein